MYDGIQDDDSTAGHNIITITWSDDHVTSISCDWLFKCHFQSVLTHQPQVEYQLWEKDAKDILSTFTFEMVITRTVGIMLTLSNGVNLAITVLQSNTV